MNPPTILAIILNWKQPELTIECVQVLQTSTYQALDILVIDNGSGDNSVELLQRKLPNCIILSLPQNLGFAAGCNFGLRWAQDHKYRWAMLLNNDAFVTPNTLKLLMEATATDIGLLSPKIFYENQPEFLWFAGAKQHVYLLEMRETGQGEQDGPKWQKTRDVDYLVGTGLLVNIMAVSRVGLLDESYFISEIRVGSRSYLQCTINKLLQVSICNSLIGYIELNYLLRTHLCCLVHLLAL